MSNAIAVSSSDFNKQVLQSAEPVLVDFWAPWCGPCLRLAPELEAVQQEWAGQLKIVKVNVDQNAELAEKMGVRGIPNLILFKDGRPVDQIVGMVPRKTISDTLRRHLPVQA
jgi:thioredoxin 1